MFLAALARATRVTVKAAFQAQDADRVGLNNWNLEGATMTVRPSGSGWIVDPFENVGISNSAGYYQF
ncbi:MAG: hypothetical protein FJ267_10670 [Planctomycetes bacterium]|nr:hypothetical protein [Planctomycetota bacterium]